MTNYVKFYNKFDLSEDLAEALYYTSIVQFTQAMADNPTCRRSYYKER